MDFDIFKILGEEWKILKGGQAHLKKENAALLEQIASLKSSHQGDVEAREGMKKCMDEMKAVKRENASLAEQILSLKRSHQREVLERKQEHKSEIGDLKKEFAGLSEQISTFQTLHNNEVRERKQEHKDGIENLKKENAAFAKRISSLKSSPQKELQDKIQECVDGMTDLKRENAALVQQISSFERSHQKETLEKKKEYKVGIKDLKKENAALAEEISLLKRSHQREELDLKRECYELRQEILKTTNTLEKLTKNHSGFKNRFSKSEKIHRRNMDVIEDGLKMVENLKAVLNRTLVLAQDKLDNQKRPLTTASQATMPLGATGTIGSSNDDDDDDDDDDADYDCEENVVDVGNNEDDSDDDGPLQSVRMQREGLSRQVKTGIEPMHKPMSGGLFNPLDTTAQATMPAPLSARGTLGTRNDDDEDDRAKKTFTLRHFGHRLGVSQPLLMQFNDPRSGGLFNPLDTTAQATMPAPLNARGALGTRNDDDDDGPKQTIPLSHIQQRQGVSQPQLMQFNKPRSGGLTDRSKFRVAVKTRKIRNCTLKVDGYDDIRIASEFFDIASGQYTVPADGRYDFRVYKSIIEHMYCIRCFICTNDGGGRGQKTKRVDVRAPWRNVYHFNHRMEISESVILRCDKNTNVWLEVEVYGIGALSIGALSIEALSIGFSGYLL